MFKNKKKLTIKSFQIYTYNYNYMVCVKCVTCFWVSARTLCVVGCWQVRLITVHQRMLPWAGQPAGRPAGPTVCDSQHNSNLITVIVSKSGVIGC